MTFYCDKETSRPAYSGKMQNKALIEEDAVDQLHVIKDLKIKNDKASSARVYLGPI